MERVPWWITSFGDSEISRVGESIRNGHISQGPVTEELEARIAELLDVPHVVATTSCSVALVMGLMALGIEKGDEVIVPNRTWIATAHAPLILGAKVVLVDVSPELPLMDVSRVREKITPKTKAVMPVHLCGRSVDMKGIHQIAQEHGLRVIEDAAQAVYSRNDSGFLGTQSDVGCFSLGMTKLISTGQGGFLATRDAETYERLKGIRNHGVTNNFFPAYSQVGCNFRITDLQASLGVSQLSRLEKRAMHIRAIYAKYADGIKGLPFIRLIPVAVSKGELPIYVEVMSEERAELVHFLTSRGIEIRPFLPDLCSAPYLKGGGEFPNSRVFNDQGFFLPCGPDQPMRNIDRVIETLHLYGGKGKSSERN